MPWLLDRLFAHNEQPAPRFAFQGTANWIRALAISVTAAPLDDNSLRLAYQGVQRRAPNQAADTLAYERLLMSLAQAAAARHLSSAEGNPYDACRSAIVAWYYCIFYAIKAMLAATNGADPQTHALAARLFQTDLVAPGLVRYPFDLSVLDLTPKSVDVRIAALRGNAIADLNVRSSNAIEAHGGLCSYLKGTCEYRQEDVEDRVRQSREFRQLNVSNFRTNAARDLRDAALRPEAANFLWQAFRYRGKANYRDAIYLSYGADNSAIVKEINSDLNTTATACVRMSAHYVSRRVEAGTWAQFSADVMSSAQFTVPCDLITI